MNNCQLSTRSTSVSQIGLHKIIFSYVIHYILTCRRGRYRVNGDASWSANGRKKQTDRLVFYSDLHGLGLKAQCL